MLKSTNFLKIITFLSLLALMTGSLSSCKGAKASIKETRIVPVKSVKAMILKRSIHTPSIRTVGKSIPFREVVLSVEMPGKIVKYPVEIGKFLHKGDLVARVRSLGLWSQGKEARAQLTTIKSTLAQASRDLVSAKKLYEKGVVTKRELELSQLKVDTEKSQLNRGKASMGRINDSIRGTTVKAPFDGEISMKNHNPGTFVGMGSPLVRLVDLSKIKINVGLTELDISQFKPGDIVKITVPAWPNKEWSGKIGTISPSVDPKSALFPVTIIMDNQKEFYSDDKSIDKKWRWKIKEGMTMKVTFLKKAVTGFFIPVDAVVERGNKQYAYLVVSDQKNKPALSKASLGQTFGVKMIRVKTMGIFEGWYQVSGEFKEGNTVVVTGLIKLRQETRIKVIASPAFNH
jgi:HlyD family secretion protein